MPSSSNASTALAFPPLPPLPPCPASSSSNRNSAPPPTSVSHSTGGRERRSRVSFREDVDVALEYRARSTSRPRSGPPAGPSSGHSIPIADPMTAQRRSSADNFQSFRKAQIAPRPALKRAASSQVLVPIKTCGHDVEDIFDAFRPQALRYPKVSPALARLSDSSMSSAALWSPTGRTTKPAAYTASPTSDFVASASSSLSSPACSTSASPSTSGGNNNGAGSRKARTPRSPIPSWSSVATSCPSLVSSHRASLASTLTAPSMTSLLLSPPSPGDRLTMPSPAYVDDAALHSPHYHSPGSLPRDTMDDVPDLEMMTDSSVGTGVGGVGSVKGRGLHHMHGAQGMMVCTATAGSSDGDVKCGTGTETEKRSTTRFRSHRTEPLSLSSSSDGSSFLLPPPPRATERLLRLQSSLADLRMQRRAEEEKQAAAADALEALRLAPTTTSPAVSPRPRAPSPTLRDLVRKAPREDLLPTELDMDSDDESDLDLSLPPLNAALRSHVIPSSSRLLVSSANGRSAEAQEKNDGWSGSESEEEEFSRTVARIAMRKTTAPTNTRRLLKRPSLPASRVSRYSDFGLGQPGDAPPSSPSTVSERSTPPSDMASRRSTANSISSARPSGTAALITALVEQKYASTETLPRPKRFVEGWGAPEVLEDDEWPPDNGSGQLETLSEVW